MNIIAKAHVLAILFSMIFALGNCKSWQIVNPPTYDAVRPDALKGEPKAWAAVEEALYSPKSKANTETRIYIMRDLGAFPTTNKQEAKRALNLLQKGLHHKNVKLRAEAENNFFQLGIKLNRDKTEALLIKAILENKKKYGKFFPNQINLLGKMESPLSERILRDELGSNPALDPLIIQALGTKMERQKSPPPPSPATESQNESDKNQEDETDEYEDEPDANAGGRALLDYLSGEYPEANKELSLKVLAKSKPSLVFRVAVSKAYNESTRLYALDLLPSLSISDAERKKWLLYLKKLYLFSEGNLKIKEAILNTVAAMKNSNPVAILKEYRKSIWKKQWARERALAAYRARRAWLRRLRTMSSLSALKVLLREEGLSRKAASAMVTKMRKTVTDSLTKGDDPLQKKVFWAALRLLYPNSDYYALKQAGQKGLKQKNFFYISMSLVKERWQRRDIRRVILARLWGISRKEAVTLDKFFSRHEPLIGSLRI